MKRFSLLLLLCLAFRVTAQNSVNSPVSNQFFTEVLKNYSINPVSMAEVPLKDFTASTLYYNFEEGRLKQGGEPTAIHDFGLKTEGIFRKENGVLFFGDLLVKKTYYRDLAWNLSYMMPEKGIMPDPHYFGVSKPGNWSNQHYELSGGIVVPIKDRWNFALATSYRLFNKYRVDLDPRPKLTYNNLKIGANIGYDFTVNHSLNIGYAYHYEDIANAISYSNKYYNVPVNYDIYVKWIAGYGSLINAFNNSIKRKNNAHHLSMGYTFQRGNDRLLVTANLERKEQLTYRENLDTTEDIESSYFGTYKPLEFNLRIMGLKNLGKGNHIKGEYMYTNRGGDNFLFSKSGKTYSATLTEHKLSFSQIQQDTNSLTDHEFGMELSYWETSQRDALAVTRSNLKNIEVELYGQKVIYKNQKIRIRPHFKTCLMFNFEENLENENSQYLENIDEYDYMGFSLRNYYNQVITPDHQLFSTSRLKIEAGSYIDFIGNENIRTLFNLKVGYFSAIEDVNYFGSSNRISTSLSLILNY